MGVTGTLPGMARKLRVDYPGAIYRVMNRGDRRKVIFRDDGDRQRFLDTLGEFCGKVVQGPEFRRELLEQMAGAMREHHDGEERWETAEAVAERLVEKELARLGWRDNDLANRAKGDPAKVATARRLRKETTMTFQVTAFPCRASSGTFGPARSTSAWNTSKERGAIR